MDAASPPNPRVRLINDDAATMIEVAKLAQRGGVAVVEQDGRFALCDRNQVPEGWHRIAINLKAA